MRIVRLESEQEVRKFELSVRWRRDLDDVEHALLRIEAPEDLRNTALLFVRGRGRTDLFAYLPAFGNVRRLNARTLHGNLLGTDLRYEDLARAQGWISSAQLELETGEGGPLVTLSASSEHGAAVGWDRIVTRVERERCVPRTIEMLEGGDLVRRIVIDPGAVLRHGSRWLPTRFRVEEVGAGTETRVVIGSAVVDTDLPNSLFSQSALVRGR